MDLAALSNFLFVPHVPGDEKGLLYELTPSDTYSANSVVLVPYQNPQTQTNSPAFFNITHKQSCSLSESETHSSEIILKAVTGKDRYIEQVRKLKEHIQLGNIYEINYCTEFYAENVTIDPIGIFKKLSSISKAPYSALLRIGTEYIISASPELFLEKQGNKLLSKPIKGTSRRGTSAEEDETLKEQLHQSLKERTENVMAVDVARNDLSMLAERGTVHVNKLYNIETFETVHQMVSTVSCDLKPGTDFKSILDAGFPMASMTGAPKLRAMTLIDSFEDFRRNYYSGAMGIIDENEDFKLSVIIRSIFYNTETKRLSIAVGGAITYLSDPEKEYEECLLKANAMLRVLNASIG